MNRRKNHDRAPGQTKISISIGDALLKQFDARAAAEYRTRSNMVRCIVSEGLGMPMATDASNKKRMAPDSLAHTGHSKVRTTP